MGRVRDAGNKRYGAARIGNHAGLVDGEEIELDDKVFELRAAGPATGTNILVLVGANAAEAVDNLKAAINAQLAGIVVAYDDPVEDETLRLEAANPGAREIPFTTTMSDPANIIAAVDDKLAGGSNDGNRSRAALEYVVTALDVAAEVLTIPTPFQSPVLGAFRVVSSTDVPKYITDKPTVANGRVVITKNGATNLAAGDKVYAEVWSAD